MKIPYMPLFVAASVLTFCPDARAADAYDACKTMMAKLAVQYEIATLAYLVKKQPYPSDGVVRAAEGAVLGAFGEPKQELDKLWPGLWQFSVLLYVDATKTLPTALQFQQKAFLSCVREFG